MKPQQIRWITVLLLFSSACVRESPNGARATQLLREINEIAQKSRDQMRADNVMGVMQELNNKKQNFPEDRHGIEDVATRAKAFFQGEIGQNEEIIDRYNELLTLGLVSSEADCIRLSIKSLQIQNENLKTTEDGLEPLFDETVKDKETFISRTRESDNKIASLQKQMAENDEEVTAKCSKSSLRVE